MTTTVLLVDDDASVRETLGRALASEQFQVATAANGEEALVRFYAGGIDLVLLDLNMPVKNGWDTFERMTQVNPLLPIIIITARPDQRKLAAAAGATAIMEKPLNLPVLVEALRAIAGEAIEERIRRIASHRPMLLQRLQQLSNTSA